MSANPDRYDVIVVGAGLTGSVLAAALGCCGVRTAVIDRAHPAAMRSAAFDGRTTAVALATQRLYDAIGVWAPLVPDAAPILAIRISDAASDGRPSPLHLHFDHRQATIGGDPPPMGWILENRHLRHALLDRLATLPTVELLAPAEVVSTQRTQAGAEIVLADGRRLQAALLASCDGRGGDARRSSGIRTLSWHYPQTAIVCVARHDLPHGGVAHEKFLPAGPFAILPMTDSEDGGHRCSIVWTERPQTATQLMGLDEARFSAELARRFGAHLGTVRVDGPRHAYPLSLLHAATYIDRRLALVGDAAHGIHPIAGQGYNLGARDVAALVEVVLEARRLGLDIGAPDVLARYERWRRFDNTTLVAATDLLNWLFSNDIAPLRLLRDAGLAAVQRIQPLKRLFMQHAMGTVGELPKLLLGQLP